MEKWLMHETTEIYNYFSCLTYETNPRVKAITMFSYLRDAPAAGIYSTRSMPEAKASRSSSNAAATASSSSGTGSSKRWLGTAPARSSKSASASSALVNATVPSP